VKATRMLAILHIPCQREIMRTRPQPRWLGCAWRLVDARRLAVTVATVVLWLAGSMQASVDEENYQPVNRSALARRVEEMYGHAFESYMAHAFPADELRPLSCDGRRFRERGDLDAMLGNYSMTLIDALDSLVIFRRYDDFERAVLHISEAVHFDLDIEVSTFELNIRVLGGLLSGHLHAVDILEGYHGALLEKAVDLAQRLRLAFETPTGMPFSRVNLRSGKLAEPPAVVTTAEAGSFVLEFGVVSLLTGDASFYELAKRSLLVFWRRRSSLDLVGTTINVNTGVFEDMQSTTGPGQDSFYEYLLKGYTLFGDLELLEMFTAAYAAVERYHAFEGFTYTVDMFKGLMSNSHLSPLSAVWGSLQVLFGDVAGGLRTVLYWHGIWRKHRALPEVFDTRTEEPTAARDSPLRPELIEALYYLSQALPGDPEILSIAQELTLALDNQSRVACGFAAVADVLTKRLDDRMDSYFLSETLVYLYLILAPPEERILLRPGVFSTEGHIFPLPQSVGLYAVSRIPGLAGRVRSLYPTSEDRPILRCEVISPFERVAMQHRCRTKYVLTPGYQMQASGCMPSRCRGQQAEVLVSSGADTALWLEGTASSFGPELSLAAPPPPRPGKRRRRWRMQRRRRGRIWNRRPSPNNLGLKRLVSELAPGIRLPFASVTTKDPRTWDLFMAKRLALAMPLNACAPLESPAGLVNSTPAVEHYEGRIVVATRGDCLFLHKVTHMQNAHAAGAVFVDQATSQELQVMTCPMQERGAGRELHIPAALVSQEDGMKLLDLLWGNGTEEFTASIYTFH